MLGHALPPLFHGLIPPPFLNYSDLGQASHARMADFAGFFEVLSNGVFAG
jgi:hypothetical protein